MSNSGKCPERRPVFVALFGLLLALAVAVFAAGTAHAAYYKTLYCAAADSSGDPARGARPGFFDFTDNCGTAYGDPAGEGGFLRLEENTTGTAGNTDEASYSWWAPAGTSIAAVSAYTREPGAFNQGWRARFWAEGFDGSENNVLMQGYGVANDGLYAPSSGNFGFHPWPFGAFGDYKRLVFALACYRPAGCDRAGWNAADANSIAITLSDKQDARVNWEGDSRVLAGDWVRGQNPVAWRESDAGSGLRFSRLRVDGAVLGDGTIDYQANGGCRTGRSDANGEFARDFLPCTPGPYLRYYGLDTAKLSDGAHAFSVCLQDYAQYQHVNGAASETCESRTIHTDNTAPGKPAELRVMSANPARYLDRFGATFSLPLDEGSPIAKVHYLVLDAAGKVAVPERTVSETDPTSLADIEGSAEPGAYTLRVWLEDAVGLIGPAAEAPIPHDTTPPAAPQEVSVTPPETTRGIEGFDVRWRNVTDEGSPIAAARYEVVDGAGRTVVPATTAGGSGIEAIADLQTPRDRGAFTLRLWLSDEEGNVGVPVSVPLSYRCVRSDAIGATGLTSSLAPGGKQRITVGQGTGATLSGTLLGGGGGIANAPLCVFAKVLTDSRVEFLGVALTGADGHYEFAVPAGPSRDLTVAHRAGQREVASETQIATRVKPYFSARRKVVHNKGVARFIARIPGPHNDHVVLVFQVKRGDGWLAFRRCKTGTDGSCAISYRFTRTDRPTLYLMRAQVREQAAYPYLQGTSKPLRLIVLPAPRRG